MFATVPLLLVFQLRADARAYLLKSGEFETWNDAFGPLVQVAIRTGLAAEVGNDVLEAIIDQACADIGIEFENGE
jgi:hypothetical protein